MQQLGQPCCGSSNLPASQNATYVYSVGVLLIIMEVWCAAPCVDMHRVWICSSKTHNKCLQVRQDLEDQEVVERLLAMRKYARSNGPQHPDFPPAPKTVPEFKGIDLRSWVDEQTAAMSP
jgi:hypothetical protein